MTTPNTSLVERMARAICEAEGLDWEAQSNPQTSGSGNDDTEHYFEVAIAALKAMREPTPKMYGAGGVEQFKADMAQTPPRDAVGKMWQAMITAALQEHEACK